jgi:hypothetical protein
MTNREALEAFGRKERLDQPTIRRLLDAGLIEASDVTHMQTPAGEKDFLITGLTPKGRKLLEKGRDPHRKKGKQKSWYQRMRQRIPRIELKVALGIFISLLGLALTYKYAGADDLRNKVYSPINADLEKMEGSVRGNSMTNFFSGNSLGALKQSGDFYRMPKSLQREISKLYDNEGALEGNVAPIVELVQRQLSEKIEAIRSEKSDREWAQEAAYRIRAEDLNKPGVSTFSSSTFTHAARGRGIDVRDPNHPVVSSPGGPTWEINDWLSYPESLKTVDAMWSDNDFLYFDDRDMWYYRITRYDLQQQHTTLEEFLKPTHEVLLNDVHFKNIQNQQPELLKRLALLKAKIADRMNEPKRLKDLFD